jgi:hypothetical protein
MKFKTWADATEFFFKNVYNGDKEGFDEAFEAWAEREQIEVEEANETEESDRYDNQTAHSQ